MRYVVVVKCGHVFLKFELNHELLFNICPPAASGDHVPHENGITEKKNDKEEVRN